MLHKKCKKPLTVQFNVNYNIFIEKRQRMVNRMASSVESDLMNNSRELISVQDFNPALFSDFVRWIDRSEKTTRTYLTNLKQFMAWLRYAGVTNPVREDIISYRQWLTFEHDAITLSKASQNGWEYRQDATGNPIKIICKPNTIAQYLRSVCQFFRWTASNNLYPDIAQNIHAPKIKHNTHKKDALTPNEVLQIENSISEQTKAKKQFAAYEKKDTQGRIQRSQEQGKRLYAMYLLAVNAGLRTI